MANKNYGKILLDKKVPPKEDPFAIKSSVWSAGDNLLLTNIPSFYITPLDIVNKIETVSFRAVINNVNILHGVGRLIKIYALPYKYTNAVDVQLSDEYLLDSTIYYNHIKNYVLDKGKIGLDKTPNTYTFVAVIVGDSNEIAEYANNEVKLYQEMDVLGLHLRNNLLDMQNVTIEETSDTNDINKYGYKNSQLLTSPKVNLSWGDITKVKQTSDFTANKFSSTWYDIKNNQIKLYPETIQQYFKYYVIYIYVSDSPYHPKYRRPNNLDFDISPNPTSAEMYGEWQFIDITTENHYTMTIPFDKYVAFWIGAKFD